MPVVLGDNSITIDGKVIETSKFTVTEKMYPPVRNFTEDDNTVSGQDYGSNGVYTVSYSSFDANSPTLKPYTCFNESINEGGLWGAANYTAGVYNKSLSIDGTYLGDWLKIKLPIPVRLTKYGILQRSSSQLLRNRAPNDFKIYGSNDNINWTVLASQTTISYDTNYLYEENISNENYYIYYALVVNKLLGTDGTVLNFDEWFLYGAEGTIVAIDEPVVDETEIIQYPETPSTNANTWTDGAFTVITKSNNAVLGAGNNLYFLFDNNVTTTASYHSTLVFSATTPFAFTGSTSFKGSNALTLQLDLGRSIYPRSMRLFQNFNQSNSYAGIFKIYASNDSASWTDDNHSSWTEIHSQTTILPFVNGSFVDFGDFSNINNLYRYFTMAVYTVSGNYTYLVMREWDIFGTEIIIAEQIPNIDYKILAFPFTHQLYYEFNADPNSWDEANTFAINKGGRMPTVKELVDWLAINGRIITANMWSPAYNPNIASPHKDWVQVGLADGTNGTPSFGNFTGRLLSSALPNSPDVVSTDGGGTNPYNDYYFWTFDYTQYTVNFPEPAGTECDILIVGGGGGGGSTYSSISSVPGGGGGAGGLIFLQNQIIPPNEYIIKVGKGGAGDIHTDETEPKRGKNGNNSSFSYLLTEAIGGGGGGSRNGTFGGGDGGSGGGSYREGEALVGGDGTIENLIKYDGTVIIENYIQGFKGGTGGSGSGTQRPPFFGGGGGAGEVGYSNYHSPDDSLDANGGNGLASKDGYDFKTYFNITDTTIGQHHTDGKVYFAGGGSAGFSTNNDSFGGLGGGGSSSTNISNDGLPNTGGGGGGARAGNSGQVAGGNGGSGIVIIRYKTTRIDAVPFPSLPHNYQWTYNSSNANVYHFGNVGIGTTNPTSSLHVVGNTHSTTYSGGSKNFKIEHPLKIKKWLYHGCIEGPRFDNIYRGKTLITEGKAEVDIDKECNTTGGMTSGTFPALNTNYQLYLQNNKTFDRVKGKISGSAINIECENTTDELEIDWLVVGERHDEHVINTPLTDHDGNLICEHYFQGYNKYNSGEPLIPDRIVNVEVTEEYIISDIDNNSNVTIEEDTSNTSNVIIQEEDTSNI